MGNGLSRRELEVFDRPWAFLLIAIGLFFVFSDIGIDSRRFVANEDGSRGAEVKGGLYVPDLCPDVIGGILFCVACLPLANLARSWRLGMIAAALLTALEVWTLLRSAIDLPVTDAIKTVEFAIGALSLLAFIGLMYGGLATALTWSLDRFIVICAWGTAALLGGGSVIASIEMLGLSSGLLGAAQLATGAGLLFAVGVWALLKRRAA